jgi:site-specific recombinase XerD
MSRLRSALKEYLALRRALGYKLYRTELQLKQFVEFAEHAGATYITTELALKWATNLVDARQYWWAQRLSMVRGFAEYCTSFEARTVVPPSDLLPYAYQRVSPRIYRDEDIRRLLKAARQLSSTVGLRPHTYAALFGLYVSTGLRTSEPLGLDRDDVDLQRGVLTIHGTKFDKARYIPVHLSTQLALQRYAKIRDRLCRYPNSPSFFLSDQGRRLSDYMVRWTFIRLSRQIGLRDAGDSHGHRIHDFRHRLAITRLTHWHHRGLDVERRLPQLCAFLGHAYITDTQWYLTATPQLLRHVLKRVERGEHNTRR